MKNIILKVTSSLLLCSMLKYAVPAFAYTKDETVYSKINLDGEVYRTIVNDHIKNIAAESTIRDLSDLSNIENVKGDEEFTQEDNSLIWKADGKDIYYQGESQKELPIECKIKYELNGSEISAKELAGKSGNVKLTIEYINKDAHVVNINGKNETIYTPFVVVCGTIIDNEISKNIEISNGKVIDNGNKTIVIGLALPGLQESLGVSTDKIDIPGKVEISFDVKDFEMGNIISYVTPKILEDKDIKSFDKIDEIFGKVDTLQDAADKIEEGANTLKEGTEEYSEKSQEFNSAIKSLSDGMTNANENYTQIDNAINLLNQNSTTLQSGAKTISDGTTAVSDNLSFLSEKLAELEAGNIEVLSGENKLEAGLDQIILGLSQIDIADNSNKISELTKLVKTNESTIATLKNTNTSLETSTKQEGIDEVSKQTLLKQIEANKSIITLLEANDQATSATIETLKSTDSSEIQKLKAGLAELKQGVLALQNGTTKVTEGTTAIKDGANTLAEKTEELSQGANALYQGTTKIATGTKTLNAGSNKMKEGLNTLDSSTGLILDANNKLTDGAETIKDGASTLAEGISEFNKEGIEKIVNYINGDVKDIQAKLEALKDLSQKYNNFTMLNNGNEGTTKFVLIIDSIKNDNIKKEEIILNDIEKEKIKTE